MADWRDETILGMSVREEGTGEENGKCENGNLRGGREIQRQNEGKATTS